MAFFGLPGKILTFAETQYWRGFRPFFCSRFTQLLLGNYSWANIALHIHPSYTHIMKLSSYMCLSSAGWVVLVALLVIAMFSSSCASSGYCKSWNNPAGQVDLVDLSDKG